MPEIELDKEGNTIYIDDDGQRQTLIERIGPGMTEKHNRLRELAEQQKELDEKLTANSKEQGQIIRSLVTRVEQEPQQGPQKDPMDMTLDELYEAYLGFQPQGRPETQPQGNGGNREQQRGPERTNLEKDRHS